MHEASNIETFEQTIKSEAWKALHFKSVSYTSSIKSSCIQFLTQLEKIKYPEIEYR